MTDDHQSRGLKCPLPALRTRKALSSFAGDLLTVECTDPLVNRYSQSHSRNRRHHQEATAREQDAIVFKFENGSAPRRQCRFEVRHIAARSTRTSESKDTSKSMILCP